MQVNRSKVSTTQVPLEEFGGFFPHVQTGLVEDDGTQGLFIIQKPNETAYSLEQCIQAALSNFGLDNPSSTGSDRTALVDYLHLGQVTDGTDVLDNHPTLTVFTHNPTECREHLGPCVLASCWGSDPTTKTTEKIKMAAIKTEGDRAAAKNGFMCNKNETNDGALAGRWQKEHVSESYPLSAQSLGTIERDSRDCPVVRFYQGDDQWRMLDKGHYTRWEKIHAQRRETEDGEEDGKIDIISASSQNRPRDKRTGKAYLPQSSRSYATTDNRKLVGEERGEEVEVAQGQGSRYNTTNRHTRPTQSPQPSKVDLTATIGLVLARPSLMSRPGGEEDDTKWYWETSHEAKRSHHAPNQGRINILQRGWDGNDAAPTEWEESRTEETMKLTIHLIEAMLYRWHSSVGEEEIQSAREGRRLGQEFAGSEVAREWASLFPGLIEEISDMLDGKKDLHKTETYTRGPEVGGERDADESEGNDPGRPLEEGKEVSDDQAGPADDNFTAYLKWKLAKVQQMSDGDLYMTGRVRQASPRDSPRQSLRRQKSAISSSGTDDTCNETEPKPGEFQYDYI